MKAIVIGATGATGTDLLDLLLQDRDITEVLVFARKELAIKHERLKVEIIDFAKPNEWADKVRGDILFSCLGTTLRAAGSKEAQWTVDYTYQYNFAEVAKRNNVKHYVLVSSAGADASSKFYYMRMKGALDEGIKALGFTSVQIYRPPMLVRRGTDRLGEQIGAKIIAILNSIGLLRGMKPMSTEVLARVMLANTKQLIEGIHIYNPRDIWSLA